MRHRGLYPGGFNAENFGFIQYLKAKSAITESQKTIIPEEKIARSINRPTLYNRCLLGDGTSTVALGNGIIGTLTLKGWTKEGGVWAYRNITTGLSGTTLTLQSGVYYLSIDRYENGVYKDTAVCEEGSGVVLYFNSGDNANITATDISLVRVTQDDAPLLELSGDILGYYNSRFFNGTDSYIRVGSDLILSNITGNSFSFKVSFSNLNVSQAGFNYVFNGNTIFLARYGSAAPNRWAFGNFFGWCIFEFTTTDTMEFYCVHDISEVGMDRFKLYINGAYQTRIGVDGVYSTVINDANPIILGARNFGQGFLNFTLEELITYSGVVTDGMGTKLDKYTKIGNYYNEISNDVPSVNTTVELIISKKHNENVSVNNLPLTYQGRKDQPLTLGGAAIIIDAAQTTRIKFAVDETDTLGTIIKVYGEKANGDELEVLDFEISKEVLGDYIQSVGLIDCKLARIDWSNGSNSNFTGNTTNDSEIITDTSGNGNHAVVVSADIEDANSTQKYYNVLALNGFTIQSDGGTTEYVPLSDGGSTITHSGFTVSETIQKGVHIPSLLKNNISNPLYKTNLLALQSNEDLYREADEKIDRILSPISYNHADKGFLAVTLDFSAGDYIQGDIGEDWTSVTIIGYEGNPTYSIADFTIDTVNNRISAASADAQFAQIELSNGNKYHRRDASTIIHNAGGAGNNGILVCASTAFSYSNQDNWNWEVEYNPSTARTKALKYTNNA